MQLIQVFFFKRNTLIKIMVELGFGLDDLLLYLFQENYIQPEATSSWMVR